MTKRLEEIRARLDEAQPTAGEYAGHRLIVHNHHEHIAWLIALIERQAKALEVADAAFIEIGKEYDPDDDLTLHFSVTAVEVRAEIAELMKEKE